MIVVDTNIIAYLLIESALTESAIQVRRTDRMWSAPGLWRSEFRNLLMLYIRRQTMATNKAISFINKAEELVESCAVDSARVIDLAADSGCTAYDCEFVSLAERLNVPLVTSDKKLLAAFPGIAISMDAFTA